MTPDRWRQIGQLYDAALELEPEARPDFLAGACGGDEPLRREVESLLRADARADGFIAGKVAGAVVEFAAGQQTSSLVGHSLRHYQVLSLLGAGGMGEVYLAEDTQLERKVALKILPAEFTEDPERVRRFKQEARAASALNHPNILTIHEIGQTDQTHFIVTEFIDGQTLRQQMRSTPMNQSAALEIAIQIANALAAAHEAGIVHRDIKPENVMVRRDGYVKVLDFGLAKLTETQLLPVDSEAVSLARLSTEPGMVLGTVSYMSPEQARGLKVDHRTDIFSLGVMLYEMLASRRPFEGATMSDVIAALLTAEPPPLGQLCAEAPAELERIVGKCLAKDREDRYQSADELIAELKALRTGSQAEGAVASRRIEATGAKFASWRWPVATAIAAVLIVGLVYFVVWWRAPAVQTDQIKSLAVLPLENLSGDPAQEYFADGMTDALIGDLAKIGALRVISRTSAMHYKGTKKSLPEIARELNVDAVIEGTVQRFGDRVRVRAQLVRAATDQPLWSRNWDRDLREVLSLQSEIAQAIAREVQIKLTPAEQTRLAISRPVNLEAYQAYLNGKFYWNQARQATDRDAEELYMKSFGYFERAIKIDPNYAQAYAGLARSYQWLASRGHSYYKFYPQARAAAQQALALDETLSEAHDALAFTLWRFEWDWTGAEREYKRAIELGADSEVHHGYSLYLSAAGHHTEAIAEMKRAQELDPLTLPVKYNLGFVYFQARQYDEAIELFRNFLDLAPNDWWVRLNLGVAYAYQRRYEEGIAEIQRVIETANLGPNQYPRGYLAWAYAEAGKSGEALKILDELKTLAQQYPVLTIEIARTYAVLGEKDQAIDWLERAYQARTYRLLLINCFPEFDSLHSDPRWKELLRRMNFPDR